MDTLLTGKFFSRAFWYGLLINLLFCGAGFASDIDNGGHIKGLVTTSDNKPAPGVVVVLKGSKKTTITDDDGAYLLRNITPGQYTIQVSLTGYETSSQSVTVEKDKTITINLHLNISEKNLNEVEITGTRNKYTKSNSDYVAKLPLKNIENPQVYSVISADLLKDQVVSSFDDALNNAPGLSKLWSSTGREGDGAGYYSLRGFAVQPTLVNGLPGLTNGGLDVVNIDRIEVVKGPSGTLFGSSVISYGGLINTITKKPYDHFGGEISYTGGSYGLNRLTMDINTPLDKDKKVLLRVTGAYHDENSFQDAGFAKRRFIAPSLTYKVNDRLTLMLNTEFLLAESTNPTMLFFDRGSSLFATNLAALGYDYRRSYTSNNLSIKTPTSSVQAQAIYKLSNAWTSQTIVSRGTAKSEGYYSYLYEGSANTPGFPNISPTFARYISYQNGSTNTTDIQQNFIGDFKIGQFRNRMVAGLDYFSRGSVSSATGYAMNGIINMAGADNGILSKQHTDSLLNALPLQNANLKQDVYSAYVSDVFNFLPNLSAMVSLRVDHFTNGGLTLNKNDKYQQTTVSPKFGLVYQPIPNTLSVFANYMNGFSNANSAPKQQGDNSIKTFKPEQANQLEAGMKASLLGGMITGSVSYYDIKVKNIIMEIPNQPRYYNQGGEKYSRGIEAEITANPVAGLNVIAGYSYNDSKITKTDAADYMNRRPEEAGPQNLANLWVTYKFQQGAVKGFGIGFGGNYAGENIILNRATTGIFTLPAYTVLNGSLFYNTNKFGVAFKLDNLTNQIYYKGWSTLEPQMPRRFSGNVTYKF
ncbi:TonB-dependent receptor [Chitinophaga polysaccharea]|uniref:TonB-dependent receptor n=1 Tax=Chitinophaga polysaccharea TaxID=1293035 RepID=UPI001455C3BC|nr:TonB-dependent receptor [Chitinophaga polysaccharea]NLR60299.1 TonB-dependent receptor [Chitinophaga polysaccharea]